MAMIDAAEKARQIKPDTIIVEPTSGNTGIGLAFVCAARGYKLIADDAREMSMERRLLLAPSAPSSSSPRRAEGMPGAISAAEEMAARRRRRVLHAAAVQEPGEPRDPPPDDRRGDLARHRRPGRHPRRRRRHRRHDHRRRRGAQGAQARRSDASPSSRTPRRCCRAARTGPHKIQGIGAGFVPDVLNTQDLRRGHPGEERRRLRDGARAAAREEGLLGRHLVGRRALGGGQVGAPAGERRAS